MSKTEVAAAWGTSHDAKAISQYDMRNLKSIKINIKISRKQSSSKTI